MGKKKDGQTNDGWWKMKIMMMEKRNMDRQMDGWKYGLIDDEKGKMDDR